MGGGERVELERDVEQHLMRSVESMGGMCIKHGQDGWPDRIVLLPDGRVTWVELKRTKGKLADLQKYRAAQLEKVGQEVVCLWSKDEVDKWIKEKGTES